MTSSRKLQANGYVRTDTVADAGEYAVRGGIVDLFPSGESEGLRLDFFGDEIDSIRRFDPADQRTTGRVESFIMLPASEALLDEDSIKRFRGKYRELFGATATGDPLYQAISEGRRLAGMEHWLPLFEERLDTLFDHLGENCVIVRDAGVPAAADSRFAAIADYYDNRIAARSSDPGSYRPLDPATLYLSSEQWAERIAAEPLHITGPFREPDSDAVVDFDVIGSRDFAPERQAEANVYEAVGAHIGQLAQENRKVVLASYSVGSRERLAGLLEEHGLKNAVLADSWQAALGAASPRLLAGGAGGGNDVRPESSANGMGDSPTPSPSRLREGNVNAALAVIPLDHGFTTPDIALLTEQDMLGDRLRRRARRRKSGRCLSQRARHA